MADLGHELTDEILANLEQDIADEYAIAVRDMQKKLTDYLEQDEAKRKIQERLLKEGAITQQEYNDWVYRHTMMGKRWQDMLDVLSEDMVHTNEIALGIARKKMPDVYALNSNFALYQIEHDGKIDTGMSLYSHDTAEHLLEKQRQLMPGPSTKKAAQIAANKDLQWNYKKIQSAVLQGVLQGESPYDVAKRLSTVGRMNYNAAVRYARTMTTNAQNSGRYNTFERANSKGIDLTIEWQATLDGRTRHSHRMMHGQRRDVGEPFMVDGVKIMWPGNDRCDGSTVPQEMIWNCRCTLLSWVKGFEPDTVKQSPKMGDMSFEEWQNEKAPKKKTKRTPVVSSPTIESRNPVGKPSAVIGGEKLNKRQENILSALQNGNGRAILKKSGVSMRDLAALTAQEEIEFAMLTRKSKRMVYMGTRGQVPALNDQTAAALAKDGWRLSGHTHAVGGLIPSNGDMLILNYFGQERSALYDPVGNHVVFYRKEMP